MKFPLSVAALLLFHVAFSQGPCKEAPADCPINGVDDYGTLDDSTSRMHNPVVPQEITMENRLRKWTGDVLDRIAKSKGWQVYQISELASSGYSTPDGVIIAYPYRPPHWYYVTWEFIVNKDSLEAWRSWLTDFGQQRLDALNQAAASQTAAYDRGKPFRDSADHYGQLMGQYMQDHMAQYQKDLMAGNKAGIATYEKAVTAYQKKTDYFSQKAAGGADDGSAEKSASDAETVRTQHNIHYRDASLLVVEFGFNMDYVKTAGTAGQAASPIWYRNADPDPISIDFFDRSATNVVLLEGNFSKKPGGYRPAFQADKLAMDVTTDKKIKCDRVQSVDCHLSGNPQAIRQFLAALPEREIKALMTN